eukprot:scaffold38647_cov63-Phaeocystis_antarctica.AAC.1
MRVVVPRSPEPRGIRCCGQGVLVDGMLDAFEDQCHCAIRVGEENGKEPVGCDGAVDLIPDGQGELQIIIRAVDLALQIHVIGELVCEARLNCVVGLSHAERDRRFAALLHLRVYFVVSCHTGMVIRAANPADLHEVEGVIDSLQIQHGAAVHVGARTVLEKVVERLQECGNERKTPNTDHKACAVILFGHVRRGQEGKDAASHGQDCTWEEEGPKVPPSKVRHREAVHLALHLHLDLEAHQHGIVAVFFFGGGLICRQPRGIVLSIAPAPALERSRRPAAFRAIVLSIAPAPALERSRRPAAFRAITLIDAFGLTAAGAHRCACGVCRHQGVSAPCPAPPGCVGAGLVCGEGGSESGVELCCRGLPRCPGGGLFLVGRCRF